jgi:glycosyltransferase involved in cell wall biosynthesis
MKVHLENFDNNSDSGPNGFTKKLFTQLITDKKVEISNYDNCDVNFCLIQGDLSLKKPRILRLDGIYFNIDQDFDFLNSQIRKTYESSDAVIFQTEFNRNLIESWFGSHKNGHIIQNGTDKTIIDSIPTLRHQELDKYSEVWSCASAWRPHKRLNENIRYFLEFAPLDSCLVVMGKDAQQWLVNHPRIFYVGHVSWEQQISICKRSSTFLHLAWLDHCPNTVVDARAAGCKIICSTSGGTKEIAGRDSVLIVEPEWDLRPVKLYDPPKLDFSEKISNILDSEIDLLKVSQYYLEVMRNI